MVGLRFRFFLTLSLLAAAASAGGSELVASVAKVVPLSLQDALKKGLEYSLDLKKAQSQLKGAASDIDKARGSIFPVLNAKGSATAHQNAVTTIGGIVPGSFTSAFQDTYTLGLELTQPIYAGGALTTGLSYVRASEDIAQQNLFSVRQKVILNLLTTYYRLAEAQQLLEAGMQNREIMKSYMDITKSYRNIGRARGMDQLQSQVNYSLSLADVEQLQDHLNQAQAELAKVIGESPGTPYKAEFQVKIGNIAPIYLEQAYNEGLKANPDIRAATLKSEQVTYSEELDMAADRPSVNFVASAGYTSPDTANLFQESSKFYSAGLNLVIPLFSGLTSFAKTNSYAEKEYQSKRDVQLAKDDLLAKMQSAIHTMRSSEAQLRIAQDSANQARKALDAANKAYRSGTATSLDVLNLQNTHYSAEKLFVTSQYSYLIALLNLRQLMGIDLEKAYVQ